MPATRTPQRRAARKSAKTPVRPVQEVLLELAYRLHATKAVGQLQASRGR